MVSIIPDEDTITWRRIAVIIIAFILVVVAAGIGLVVFRSFFEGMLLSFATT